MDGVITDNIFRTFCCIENKMTVANKGNAIAAS
jgi:hypothetical protein